MCLLSAMWDNLVQRLVSNEIIWGFGYMFGKSGQYLLTSAAHFSLWANENLKIPLYIYLLLCYGDIYKGVILCRLLVNGFVPYEKKTN